MDAERITTLLVVALLFVSAVQTVVIAGIGAPAQQVRTAASAAADDMSGHHPGSGALSTGDSGASSSGMAGSCG
ncbi:hypothetical protein HYS54_02690 [Candidatus Micrarchaeota archaeon]|nr:hypothetical protein [Candidatus Micrarchaeota archaeon]